MEQTALVERDDTTGRFVTGNSGGGRPLGARNKLGEAFIQALYEDFDRDGVEAIKKVRVEKPDQYLKVIASLMPKEMNLNLNNDIEMTDDELLDRIRALSQAVAPLLAGTGSAATGKEAARSKEQPARLH